MGPGRGAGADGLAFGRREMCAGARGRARCMVAVLALRVAVTGHSWSPYYKVDDSPAGEPGTYTSSRQRYPAPDHRVGGAAGRRSRSTSCPTNALARTDPSRVLVVGAGNGSDVAVALAQGATSRGRGGDRSSPPQIGARAPSGPARTTTRGCRVNIDDGRAFLERTDDRIRPDPVRAAGLPDPGVGPATLRLESYLFTRQAFEAAREHLAPGGVFAHVQLLPRGWLIDRFAGPSATSTGTRPASTTSGRSGRARRRWRRPRPTSRVRCRPGRRPAGPWRRRPTTTRSRICSTGSIPDLLPGRIGRILLVTWIGVRLPACRCAPCVPYADLFFWAPRSCSSKPRTSIGSRCCFGTTWLVNAIVFAGVLVGRPGCGRGERRRTAAAQPAGCFARCCSRRSPSAGSSRPLLGLDLVLGAPGRRIALAFARSSSPTSSSRDGCRSRGLNRGLRRQPAGRLVGGALEYLALVTGYQALLLVVAALYTGACVLMRFTRPGAGEHAEHQPVTVATAPRT